MTFQVSSNLKILWFSSQVPTFVQQFSLCKGFHSHYFWSSQEPPGQDSKFQARWGNCWILWARIRERQQLRRTHLLTDPLAYRLMSAVWAKLFRFHTFPLKSLQDFQALIPMCTGSSQDPCHRHLLFSSQSRLPYLIYSAGSGQRNAWDRAVSFPKAVCSPPCERKQSPEINEVRFSGWCNALDRERAMVRGVSDHFPIYR